MRFSRLRRRDFGGRSSFRHESWLNDETFSVLRRHGAALCIHDQIEKHPRTVTTDWTYLRFHGRDGGDYPHQALSAEAKRIRSHLERGLDVYAYFNNDAHGFAVDNAQALRR